MAHDASSATPLGRSRSILAIQAAFNLNLIFAWPLISPFMKSGARAGLAAFLVLSNVALYIAGKKSTESVARILRSRARVRALVLLTSVVVTLGGVEYLAKGLTKIGVLRYDQPMRTVVPEGTEDFRMGHITADRYREADPVLFWQPIAAPPYTRQRFKGPEVERPKPPDVIRVICYGDSNTDGPRTDSWPQQLQAVLEVKGSPAWRYEVLNAGVAGYSSHQGFLRFQSQVEPYEPDVVLVSFGWNDLAPALGAPDRSFRSPPAWKIGLQRLLLHYRAYLAARHHLRSSPPRQAEGEPRVSRDEYIDNMRRFARLAGEHGVEIVFLTRPHRVPSDGDGREGRGWRSQVESYNEALRQAGRIEGWRVLDVQAWFASRDPELFVDQCHFSDEGRRVMARMVFEHLPGVLRQQGFVRSDTHAARSAAASKCLVGVASGGSDPDAPLRFHVGAADGALPVRYLNCGCRVTRLDVRLNGGTGRLRCGSSRPISSLLSST